MTGRGEIGRTYGAHSTAVIDGQPHVPLMKAAAPSERMNSESAASWPARIVTLPSIRLCSRNNSNSRVAGVASMKLTGIGDPTLSAVILEPWIWYMLT
mgnify:CR=1 FL=1